MLGILAIVATTAVGVLFFMHFWPRVAARTLIGAARLAVGVSRKEVKVEGFRLVYLEGGQGAPLILLHGLGADKDNFLLVARSLGKRFRLIVLDLPGFGESDKPPDQSYAISEQVRRLHAFSRALGIERFHLGGNSMGGFIAAAYAAEHPEDVETLWLLAPAGVRAAKPSELLQAVVEDKEAQILAKTPKELRAAVSFVMHRPVYVPRFLAIYQAEQSSRNHALHRKIIRQVLKGAWLDELLDQRVRVPTLILWGARDRAVHVSGAEVLRGLLRNSRVVVLENVGHMPMLEAPRRSVDAYTRFLDALHEFDSVPESIRPA